MSRRTGEPPNHDTLTCYSHYQCRKPACVARYQEWDRNRRAAVKAGQWQPLVDATAVREHLLVLGDRGVTIHRAAELAGLSPRSLHPLFPPKTGRRRPVRHTVHAHVAEKVLAIDPDIAAPAKIDATGTIRRIQALVATGWPMLHVATHIGIAPTYVSAIIKRAAEDRPVLSATAHKVAAAYEQLKDRNPAQHGIQPGQIKRAKAFAAANRWAPTHYWATHIDAIDDPHFEPQYGINKGQILADDARWLMSVSGLNRDQVAERLGITRSYLETTLRRYPDTAQAAA
jgi:AraC-like DNA-binding protein